MREHFDLDKTQLYLNSGTHSICPREVLQAVERYQREYELNPTQGLINSSSRLWKAHCDLAAFLNLNPEDIFLRSNVTQVMNEFVMGLDLPADSEIALSDLEYGAVANVCRLRALGTASLKQTVKTGLTLKTIRIPLELFDQASDAELATAITKQLSPKTKLLVLSHVLASTGAVLPIAEIAKYTRANGIAFVVDGAHGPGALPLDFATLADVDFYGGNLHKWFLGPKGTAFGWVPARNHENLNFRFGGWTTFEDSTPAGFKHFAHGNRFAVRSMMLGCHNYAPFFAVHETYQFWQRLGTQAIRHRIDTLQAHLDQEMKHAREFRPVSPRRGPRRGPLVGFELPARLQAKGHDYMVELFEKHRLQLNFFQVSGKWALRFSPHIYNTEEEISKAVEILLN